MFVAEGAAGAAVDEDDVSLRAADKEEGGGVTAVGGCADASDGRGDGLLFAEASDGRGEGLLLGGPRGGGGDGTSDAESIERVLPEGVLIGVFVGGVRPVREEVGVGWGGNGGKG